MDDKEFKQIRKEFDEMATKELDDRGPSYAENEDRLANFKVLGQELGMPPMQVLMVYLKKHMRSIERYARDGHQTSEGVITNFIGVRNYLDLAVALMRDLGDSKTKTTKCKNCGHDNFHRGGYLMAVGITNLCEAPDCDCRDYETN